MTDLIALPHTNTFQQLPHLTLKPHRPSVLARVMVLAHKYQSDPRDFARDFRCKPTPPLPSDFLCSMDQIRLQLESKVRNAGYLGPLDFELNDFRNLFNDVPLGEGRIAVFRAVDVWYRTVYQRDSYWEKVWRDLYEEETPLTKQQEFAFFDAMRNGPVAYRARWRDLFLHRNKGLVGKVIKFYTGKLHNMVDWDRINQELPTERDLLFRAGYEGLTKAVDKFKPELGYKFSTHAWKWIKFEITGLFKGSKAELVELNSMGDDEFFTLLLYPEGTGLRLPEDYLELNCAVGQALDRLNDSRNTQIIIMRYGLFGGKEHTFKEIGAACGITLQRVHKLLPTILAQLKEDRELRRFWNRWKNPERWANECDLRDLRALGIEME